MAIDRLQEKIRKCKNPLAVDFGMLPEHIPAPIGENSEGFLQAYRQYVSELLTGLKGIVPAVRFDMGALALYGAAGMETLEQLLAQAKTQGYYVFLEGAEALSAQSAQRAAAILFSADSLWQFDGLILAAYIGSDSITPYVSMMKETDKDLFLVARTSNRSAAEMQDLLTGSRLAHVAKADVVNRFARQHMGRSNYSRVALVAAASSANSLRTLRATYKDLFMLLDGCDYPNANVKNCSNAFDKLGHGAVACAGLSVSAAWQEETDQTDYIGAAVRAVDRFKKNIARYVTVL